MCNELLSMHARGYPLDRAILEFRDGLRAIEPDSRLQALMAQKAELRVQYRKIALAERGLRREARNAGFSGDALKWEQPAQPLLPFSAEAPQIEAPSDA